MAQDHPKIQHKVGEEIYNLYSYQQLILPLRRPRRPGQPLRPRRPQRRPQKQPEQVFKSLYYERSISTRFPTICTVYTLIATTIDSSSFSDSIIHKIININTIATLILLVIYLLTVLVIVRYVLIILSVVQIFLPARQNWQEIILSI